MAEKKEEWSGDFPAEFKTWQTKLGVPFSYNGLKSAGTETRFSSLMPWHVPDQNKVLSKIANTHKISKIVDATGHVGIDAINLSCVFKTANVTVVELNEKTYEILEKNVKNYDRIKCVRENFITILTKPDFSADLVYLDPPWGGPKYKEHKTINLTLNDANLTAWNMPKIISELFKKKVQVVCLKAPLNYSESDKIQEKWTTQVHIVHIVKLNKTQGKASYQLLIVLNK